MKLLVLSDIHDEEKALEFFEKIDYDVAVVIGDTASTLSFMQEVMEKKNTFVIPGNCENALIQNMILTSKQSLHLKKIKINEIELVGCGFSNPTPFGTPGEKSEEQLEEMLKSITLNENTLFFTHAPPFGCFDLVKGEHRGSKAIRKKVEQEQPLAIFSGHFHEYNGITKIGRTSVVKVPAAMNWMGCVCEIKKKELKKELKVKFVKL
jgi:Icc-related predicted phosphoesterase